jgi:hypothetical protein
VPDVPQFVLDRLRAKEPVFTADEAACWPDGLLDQLLAEGIVQPAENARSVACDACGHDHVEEVTFVESPPGNGVRAYIRCPQEGRVPVSLTRLRQWTVNEEKLADLGLIAPASGDDRAGLVADLRGLVDALGSFLESGETSEGYDSDALDWEAVEPAGNLHSAVCRVERHYPSKKLPAPKARNPWRHLLQTCRRQEDLFERQNKSHHHAQQLLDWAEAELSRLLQVGLPDVEVTGRSCAAEASGGRKQRGKRAPAKRSWTQTDLDEAIREYKAKRASNYGDLVDGVKRGKPGAKKSDRQLFGRNVIVRALGVKSPAMVSNSTVWQGIADDLGLRGCTKKGGRARGQRSGMEIALEEQAVASGNSAADQAIRRETIRLIEGAMPQKEAEATLEKLQRGEITDDQARELVEVHAEQKRDDRSRKLRQAP